MHKYSLTHTIILEPNTYAYYAPGGEYWCLLVTYFRSGSKISAQPLDIFRVRIRKTVIAQCSKKQICMRLEFLIALNAPHTHTHTHSNFKNKFTSFRINNNITINTFHNFHIWSKFLYFFRVCSSYLQQCKLLNLAPNFLGYRHFFELPVKRPRIKQRTLFI